MAWTCKTWSVHQLALSPALVQNCKQRIAKRIANYSILKPGRCHARKKDTWLNRHFPLKWQCSFKSSSLTIPHSCFALLVSGNEPLQRKPNKSCLRCASHCTSSSLLGYKTSNHCYFALLLDWCMERGHSVLMAKLSLVWSKIWKTVYSDEIVLSTPTNC